MPVGANNPIPSDPGLIALVMLLRFNGIGADAEQIRHRIGSSSVNVTEMIRCAKEFGLKARIVKTSWRRLSRTPLPGIAGLHDGGYLILGKIAEEENKILVQFPASPRPQAMSREELEKIWDGRVVLMARRARLSDLSTAL